MGTKDQKPKDQEAMATAHTYPSPPERREPARLTAMLAGDNDAVKNNAGQGSPSRGST